MSGEEAGGQFRIEQVQVLNWGAYHGHNVMHVDRHGTAILGPSGRGKSTLLDAIASVILPNPQEFNQAARDDKGGKRERTVYTYARGQTDKRKDDNGRTGITSYLRPPGGPGFPSGAAITWAHDDGRRVTAFRLAWVGPDTTGADGISAATVYGFIHDIFDLTRLSGIHGNRAGSSPLSRSNLIGLIDESRGDLVDASQSRMHARMRTAMAMGRTEESQQLVLQLLRRAQASKGIFNINALFKEFVLTEPEALDRWENALQAYREASGLYDEFEKARRRTETLSRLPGQAERHRHAQSSYIAKQRILATPQDGSSPRLAVWHAEKLRGWADVSVEDAKVSLAQLDEDLEAAQKADTASRAELDDVIAELTAAGGDRTQALTVELKSVGDTLRRVDARRDAVAGKLAPYRLQLPVDAGDFRLLQHQAQESLELLRTEHTRLRQLADHEVLAAGTLGQRARDLDKEIKELSTTSNIPPEAHRLREQIAAATGVPEDRLQYLGELVEIRPAHRGWEKAVLAVIGGIAQDLIVDERDLPTVRRWVNATNTRQDITLVPATAAVRASAPIPGTIPELLEIADSPYRDWVSAELVGRFSYAYVETDSDLNGRLPQGAPGAVTRAGMRTAPHGRLVKHDTPRRYRWIGWDTTRLRRELEAELEGLQRELTVADARAGDAAAHRDEAGRNADRLEELLRELTWEELDRQPHADRLATLQERLAQESTPERVELRQRLERAHDTLARTGRVLDDLRGRCDRVNKLWGALVDLQDGLADLLGAHEPISADELAELAELPFASPQLPREVDSVRDLRPATEESYREAATALRAQAQRHLDDQAQLEEAVLMTMRAYRNLDEHTAREIDEDINSLPALEAIYEQLITDDLPRAKDRWLEKVRQDMNKHLRTLLIQIDEDRRLIRLGLKPINTVLAKVPFRSGSALTIEAIDRPSPELAELRATIGAHTSNTLGLMATEDTVQIEKDFIRLRRDLAKLDDASRTGESWRHRVFDAREHVEFRAIETRTDGAQILHDGVSGMSGGEGQELIAFILGAALRYRLGEGGEKPPVYASIVLDEGFVKADSDYTGRALAALTALGFQILIGAPREKATAFEGHVENVAYISADPANPAGIHIYEMTIQQALSIEENDVPEEGAA